MAEEHAIDIFYGLPKRSLIYILVCIGGILCFIAGGILPNQSVMSDLVKEKAKIQAQLRQQEILFPIFKKALNALHDKQKIHLPVPEKSSIAKKEINKTALYFRRLATECGMHFESGIPDVGKIGGTSDNVPFHIVLTGDYFDFRTFLTRLMLVPYLAHIETLKIQSKSGVKEYRLRIILYTDTGAVKK